MEITCTKDRTTILLCNNTYEPLTIRNRLKLFERLVYGSPSELLALILFKFLDTQRIHNLIDYLEELHDHHRATSDHTTLLLNCYAKLKDVDKLEEFIKYPDEPKFDLDTAITMCRQGGYYDQAAYLARKHDEHDLVVDILVEDCKRYAEALAYIWRLEPAFVSA